METLYTALVIAAIGLFCGAIIYIAFIKLPRKVHGTEKTEELAGILSGMNCGACGYPGCFGYAQALTKDPGLITKSSSTCAVALQDAGCLEQLEKALGVTLDAAAMRKRALVHCGGNSGVIYNYAGINTCKAADQLLSGYKKCPYACLGLGDCINVCPQNAIFMDSEKNIAEVDWEKCNGCGLCVDECTKHIIELVPAETKIAFRCSYEPLRDIPGREKCDFGCTHCRKCLTACENEAVIWNKDKAIPEIDIEKCKLSLKCVEVCPQDVLKDVSRKKVAVSI